MSYPPLVRVRELGHDAGPADFGLQSELRWHSVGGGEFQAVAVAIGRRRIVYVLTWWFKTSFSW